MKPLHITNYYKEYLLETSQVSSATEKKFDVVHLFDKNETSGALYEIAVYKNNELYRNALLIGFSGPSENLPGATDNKIEGDQYLVLCNNTVLSLSFPELQFNWALSADPMDCFSIRKYENDYIVHGEVFITRLSPKGEIVWQYHGIDVFVNSEPGIFSKDPSMYSACQLLDNHIELLDYSGNSYKINYEGTLLEFNGEQGVDPKAQDEKND